MRGVAGLFCFVLMVCLGGIWFLVCWFFFYLFLVCLLFFRFCVVCFVVGGDLRLLMFF